MVSLLFVCKFFNWSWIIIFYGFSRINILGEILGLIIFKFFGVRVLIYIDCVNFEIFNWNEVFSVNLEFKFFFVWIL